MIGDAVSLLAGASLLAMSMLVILAYVGGTTSAGTGPRYLAIAIILGFIASGVNALYWQVFGQLAVNLDFISVTDLRLWGDYVDLIAKGGGALSAWYHLKALHAVLDAREKALWTPIEMPFYPRRRACLTLLSKAAALRRKE